METFTRTIRYLLRSLKNVLLLEFLVTLGTVFFSYLIYFVTARYSSAAVPRVTLTMPFELISAGCSLLIGLNLFLTDFKVILANGVSRKTYLLAALPAALFAAFLIALFNLIIERISLLIWPIIFMSQLFFPGIRWLGLLGVQVSLYWLMMLIGWLITLAYYKSSTPIRYVITLTPVLIAVLLKVANGLSGGATARGAEQYLAATTKTATVTSFTFLAYALGVGCLVFLLLRRTPYKK